MVETSSHDIIETQPIDPEQDITRALSLLGKLDPEQLAGLTFDELLDEYKFRIEEFCISRSEQL